MRLRLSALTWAIGLVVLTAPAGSQAAPRPQPYCIRGVSLDRSGERKGTLILRDGAIEAVLDEAAPAPPGTRVIDGAGLLCLPAFLDAFSRQGCSVPQPVKDQDLPPNEQADAGIDMRLANRKGIQPAFRAVEVLALSKEQSEAWRKGGFGAVLVAPGGELLSGCSALATTREAAMRDVVLRDEVYALGSFAATGSGYPSTLMGYFAQLRQFLLDSARQIELQERYEQGQPGARPPFDEQLAAGASLVAGEVPLLCEANESEDVERWLRLVDEFGMKASFAGGLEAWQVQDVLARRGITVVLTLDWGKEVKDPRPKEEKKGSKQGKEGKEDEKATHAPEAAESAVAAPKAEETPPEQTWEYEEPYAVRLERRKRWEEGRDCALRLHEAGVRFVFGTANGKPKELLEHVRTLVETGLPPEAALEALTRDAAEFLGVEQRLGRIEAGYDATFTLWRADPLGVKDASVAWSFVDGFPSEFKEEKKKGKGGEGPSEGIDPTGTWKLEFEVQGEGIKEAELTLEMAKDGNLTGALEVENPMGGARVKTDVEGKVTGDELELECTLAFGEFTIETTLKATIEGDALDGDGSFHGPWSPEPTTQSFTGKRGPN